MISKKKIQMSEYTESSIRLTNMLGALNKGIATRSLEKWKRGMKDVRVNAPQIKNIRHSIDIGLIKGWQRTDNHMLTLTFTLGYNSCVNIRQQHASWIIFHKMKTSWD